MNTNKLALLIPAYNPSNKLIDLLNTLKKYDIEKIFSIIVVVNDGSNHDCNYIFSKLSENNIKIINHAINIGKGAALKTGFNYILTHELEVTSIVTADADGQHLPEDIFKVAEVALHSPQALILGVRNFSLSQVPLRSWVGNQLTRFITRFFTGLNFSDTQTGLRAWPSKLCKQVLTTSINGYDFEMDALISGSKNYLGSLSIREVSIQTVYEKGNSTSHFNPILDSMKVYFVFIRYSFVSIISFFLDYMVYSIIYLISHGNPIIISVFVRFFTSIFNFILNKKFVFHNNEKFFTKYIKYMLSVLYVLMFSSVFLYLLIDIFRVNVYIAKPISEVLAFFLSFFLNSIFVFSNTQNFGFKGHNKSNLKKGQIRRFL